MSEVLQRPRGLEDAGLRSTDLRRKKLREEQNAQRWLLSGEFYADLRRLAGERVKCWAR